MLSENYEEALFILLFWKVGPLLWSQNASKMYLIHLQGCIKSFQLLKYYWKEVMSKNLQNKRKFQKSPKKEEGGDAKHDSFLLGPNTQG